MLIAALSGASSSAVIQAASYDGPHRDTAVWSPLSSREQSEAFDQLVSLWELRRSEIFTCRIRFREYRLLPSKEFQLSVDEFRRRLAEYDLVSDPDSLRDLAPRLSDRLWSGDPPWRTAWLTLQGSQVCWDYPPFTAVVDGETEFHWDGDNDQISVYPLGKSRRYIARPEHFRYLPMDVTDHGMARVTERSKGTLHLVAEGWQAHVDEATGLFRWREVRSRATGELASESWEQGLVEYPGGVAFPTVSIQAVYQPGRLQSVWFRIVDEAEFNGAVDPGVFEMAAGAETTIVDYRAAHKSAYLANESTPDVRRVLRRPQLAARSPQQTSHGSMQWVLAINGVVLLSAGCYLWTTGRQKRRRTVACVVSKMEQEHPPQT